MLGSMREARARAHRGESDGNILKLDLSGFPWENQQMEDLY